MVKFPFEKVLLPVDRSEHSKRAVKFAGKLLSSIENLHFKHYNSSCYNRWIFKQTYQEYRL